MYLPHRENDRGQEWNLSHNLSSNNFIKLVIQLACQLPNQHYILCPPKKKKRNKKAEGKAIDIRI